MVGMLSMRHLALALAGKPRQARLDARAPPQVPHSMPKPFQRAALFGDDRKVIPQRRDIEPQKNGEG